MSLIAFAFGLWSASLCEKVPVELVKLVKRFGLYIFILQVLAFVAALSLVIDRHIWRIHPTLTRIVDSVTAPPFLWWIAWFVTGWIVYRRRNFISDFSRSLFVQSPSSLDPKVAADQPSEKIEARPWLTKAGGLPIIGIVIAVGMLIYFGEDLRERLESFKLGPAEIKFFTATQQSLRVTIRQEAGLYRANSALTRGIELEEILDGVITQAQEKIFDQLQSPKLVRDEWQDVKKFHKTFTFPLAHVMKCYGILFPTRDTIVQQRAARIAGAWSRLTKGNTKSSTAAACNAQHDTLILIRDIRQEIETIKKDTYSLPKGCELAVGDQKPDDIPVCLNLFPQVLSHGSVVASLASLITATNDAEHAVKYLNEQQGLVDESKSNVYLIDKMYFYFRRAQNKYSSRWYKHDATADLGRAREIAEDILTKVTPIGPPDKIVDYFRMFKARIINDEIYYPFRDWLEGQELSAGMVSRLEGRAKELRDWIDDRSAKTSLDEIKGKPYGPRALAGAASDTLAMNDIAIGVIKNDLGADRCARIFKDMDEARSAYERLDDEDPNEPEYPDGLKVIETHRQLVDSVCRRQP